MHNLCTEVNEDQSVTYKSGEALGSNVHVRRSERTRKSPQRYNTGLGAAIEWNSDAVMRLVYLIRDGGYYRNLYTYKILS